MNGNGVDSETKVARMHDWKIGICHGHQIVPWGDKESMAMLQRQLDVDVLITGPAPLSHAFAKRSLVLK